MKLTSLLLKNARSLTDTGFIDLPKMTILLGQNSAGKSTFLRTLPLLRQSYAVSSSSPISWYGTNVDFGSFEKYKNRRSKSNSIVFGFEFETHQLRSSQRSRLDNQAIILLGSKSKMVVISTVEERGHNTEITNIKLEIFGNKISIDINGSSAEKISINGEDFNEAFKDLPFTQSIIPVISNILPDLFFGDSMRTGIYFGETFVNELANLDKRISNRKIFEFQSRLKLSDRLSFAEQIRNHLRYLPNSARKKLSELAKSNDDLHRLHNSFILSHVPTLLSLANSSLIQTVNSSRYIGPIRDVGERYYRSAGGINEIDARGQNVANYINQLNKDEKVLFDDWFRKNLGYEFDIESEGTHYSLAMIDPLNKEKFSLSDVGFGFSQILPILINLWDLVNIRRKDKRVESHILLIEQPELHLHPKFQGRLANMIASALSSANEFGIDIRLIVETHSDHFINALGRSIAEGKLSPSDINLVILENNSSLSTKVSKATFKSNGRIDGWPSGFMEPEI